MDANYLDMLKCLNKADVDYIMVGGWDSGRTKDLADAEILEGLGNE